MSQNSLLPIFDPQTLEQLQELVDGDDTSFLLDLFESYLSRPEKASKRCVTRSIRTCSAVRLTRSRAVV